MKQRKKGLMGLLLSVSVSLLVHANSIQSMQSGCMNDHDISQCYQLGLAYVNGDGIAKNSKEGRKYLSIACKKGKMQEACDLLNGNVRKTNSNDGVTTSINNVVKAPMPNQQNFKNSYIGRTTEESHTRRSTMNQNGLQVVLGMHKQDIVNSVMVLHVMQLKTMFYEQDIIYTDLHVLGNGTITFELLDSKDIAKIEKIFSSYQEEMPGAFYLNKNGLKFTFGVTSGIIGSIEKAVPEDTIKIIKDRLDRFGLSGYSVVQNDNGNIVVDILGIQDVKDKERIYKLIVRQGAFKIMRVVKEQKRTSETMSVSKRRKFSDIISLYSITGREYKLQATPISFGKVQKAQVKFSKNNQPLVGFTLNDSNKKRVSDITGRNIGKQIAIVLDNKIYAVYKIDKMFVNLQGALSDLFTIQEAHDLAIVLNSGVYMAPIYKVENSLNKNYSSDKKMDQAEKEPVNTPVSHVTSVKAYKDKCLKGDMTGCYQVGRAYFNGEGGS